MWMYKPDYLGRDISRRDYIRMILKRVRRSIKEFDFDEIRVKGGKDPLNKIGRKVLDEIGIHYKVVEENWNTSFIPLEDFIIEFVRSIYEDKLEDMRKKVYPFFRVPREEVAMLGEKYGIKYSPKSSDLDWFLEKIFEIGPTIKFSWVNGILFILRGA